jgi:hypothetical protein
MVFNIEVKEGTKTLHVYEHDKDIVKADVSCGCMEIININSGNLVFSFRAPKIEKATKEYHLYKGHLDVSKTIRITDKSGKHTLQVNAKVYENQ